METVNVHQGQPETRPQLPSGQSPWPEVVASWVATAVVFLSLWSMPAVLFGCVIVAILGK